MIGSRKLHGLTLILVGVATLPGNRATFSGIELSIISIASGFTLLFL